MEGDENSYCVNIATNETDLQHGKKSNVSARETKRTKVMLRGTKWLYGKPRYFGILDFGMNSAQYAKK